MKGAMATAKGSRGRFVYSLFAMLFFWQEQVGLINPACLIFVYFNNKRASCGLSGLKYTTSSVPGG
jgi:hypothetical protein